MEKQKNRKAGFLCIRILLFVMTGACMAAAGYLHEGSVAEMLTNVIYGCVGAGCIVFLMTYAAMKNEYLYDNQNYSVRFFIVYTFGLICVSFSPYLPEFGLPLLPFAVMLMLLSNTYIGLCAANVLLLIAGLFCDMHVLVFSVYFLSMFAAIILFRSLDYEYQFGMPLLSSSIIFMTLSIACTVLYFKQYNLDNFALPLLNLFISVITLLFFLRYYSGKVVHKYRDIYGELNQTEHPLLVQLKEKSRTEYYRAIHTAYLSDKIARQINANCFLTKAGGYYHRITQLDNMATIENIRNLSNEYHFPEELTQLLTEYAGDKGYIRSKETTIVYLSDKIVASILNLLEKDKDVEPDYESMIEKIFKRQFETEVLQASDLSMKDLYRMKEIFIEEKMYYDFLR